MKVGVALLSNSILKATGMAFLYTALLVPCHASFSLDGTFGNGGRVTMAFPDSSAFYSSSGFRIFVQPGGRIIAAGSFTRAAPDGQLPGIAVVGLTASGAPDPTYAPVMDWQSNGFSSLADALMYPDGRVLRLSGFTNVVGSSTGRVARTNVDGAGDGVFETNASIGASSGGFGTVRAYQVAVRGDAKVLVLITEDSQFFLYRLNADGTRDSSFGVNGVVEIKFNKFPVQGPIDMIPLPDGKVLIAGHVSPPNFPAASSEFFLARLTETGSWDKTFGRAGSVRFAFGPGMTGQVGDTILQANGNILLCGSVSGLDMDLWMMRLRPNGRPDTTFGTGGVVISDFAPGGPDSANAIALSPDGKIRVVGSVGAPLNFLVARFSAGGELEDNMSIAFTPGQYAVGNDITFQPDGKLVVIGQTKDPNPATAGGAFAIARLIE